MSATSTLPNIIRIWDLDIDALMDRARRLAGRELTAEERKQYMVDGLAHHFSFTHDGLR